MINAQQMLNSLYGLKAQSASSVWMDAAVNHIANKGKRESLLKGIFKVEERLDDFWRKQMLVPILQTTTLVRSSRDFTGRITQKFESDSQIIMDLILQGDEAWRRVDSEDNRYLYFAEFKQRLTILAKHILAGKNDAILPLSPENCIHMVMGFSGELLLDLQIDPRIGETYTRLIKHIEPSPERLTWVDAVAAGVIPILESIKKSMKDAEDEAVKNVPIMEAKEAVDIDSLPEANPAHKHINIDAERKYPIKPLKKAIVIKKPYQKEAYPSNIPESEINRKNSDKIVFGIEGKTLTPEIMKNTGLPETTTGVLVLRVFEDSIADYTGLRGCVKAKKINGEETPAGGDIITKVDGLELKTVEDLRLYFYKYYVEGQKISLRIIRDNSELDLTLN